MDQNYTLFVGVLDSFHTSNPTRKCVLTKREAWNRVPQVLSILTSHKKMKEKKKENMPYHGQKNKQSRNV